MKLINRENLGEIYAAITAGSGVAFYNIANTSVFIHLEDLHRIAMSALIAIILLIIMGIIPIFLLNVKFIRNLAYPHTKLEGYWFQEVAFSERPYSISRIYWSIFKGWQYEGIAYGKDFVRTASWNSRSIYYDKMKKFWSLKGRSQRHESNGNVYREGNVMTILYSGHISHLQSFDGRQRLPGRIFDLDFEDEPDAAKVMLYKVLKEDWVALKNNKERVYMRPNEAKVLINSILKNK